MINTIINRLNAINNKVTKILVNSKTGIYKWGNNSLLNKHNFIINDHKSNDANLVRKRKPRNLITNETLLYNPNGAPVVIPEITLDSNFLAVNGTGYNIPTIYPFFAITEGCKFLLNYDYTDYPYTCVCQVFDLKNYTGRVIETFGSDFKMHFDFIKYVKKKYGFAKTCNMPTDVTRSVYNTDNQTGQMDTPLVPTALPVDLENCREKIYYKYYWYPEHELGYYCEMWIPMLDIKAAWYNTLLLIDF